MPDTPRHSWFSADDAPAQNLALFLITALCVVWVFAEGWTTPGLDRRAQLVDAAQFAGPLLAVILAQSLGRTVAARWHGVPASLPWFLPLPFGLGTVGALVRLKGPVPNRAALAAIGAAGTLGGVVTAAVVLGIGLSTSQVISGAPISAPGLLGDQSVVGLIRLLLEDKGAGASGHLYFGDSVLTWLVQRLVVGELPPGADLQASPTFLAGWYGLLLGMFSATPLGQLDGGNLAYALLGPKGAQRVGRAAVVLFLVLGLVASLFWLVGGFVAWRWLGTAHPGVVDERAPLSTGRKVLCVLGLVCFLLTLMPVPMGVVP